ncbi:unnamed protein product [Ambrosiozyma monospora]|uniref:Unnamed protein product n=1 Tax=Ambrosiozyma monospora TaxID=43982 RepID=A0ACB5U8Y2_AMBMO|nr:unnamed protein product [Ambrosiozyma monospora]
MSRRLLNSQPQNDPTLIQQTAAEQSQPEESTSAPKPVPAEPVDSVGANKTAAIEQNPSSKQPQQEHRIPDTQNVTIETEEQPTTTSKDSNDQTTTTTSAAKSTNEPNTSTGWWSRWSNWNSVALNHSDTIDSTEEEARRAVHLVSNQGPQSQATCSWAYYSHYEPQPPTPTNSSFNPNSNSDFNPSSSSTHGGQIAVFGSTTAKKPVPIDTLPSSQFEKLDSPFVLGSSVSTSLVLPDLNNNYRDLTLRTKSRILLSSFKCFEGFLEKETHLYHDPNATLGAGYNRGAGHDTTEISPKSDDGESIIGSQGTSSKFSCGIGSLFRTEFY